MSTERDAARRPDAAPRIERLVSPGGDVEVEVLPEAGGRLHRLRVRGADLLRTPDDPVDHFRDPFFWGAYPMAPWCNRLDPGVVDLPDGRVVLAANFRDRTAMHGEVYRRPWHVVGEGRFAVRGGGDAWPWPYEVSLAVDVADDRVALELALTNLADRPMPGGIGLHPWFRRPVEVAIHASAVYPDNAAAPVVPEPVGGRHDVRRLAPMPPGLDATWSGIGDPAVELAWPDRGLSAAMHVSSPTVLICAASPTDVDANAVEPQTHAPQGLRRLLLGQPDPMTWIQPGDALHLRIDLEFRSR